MTLQVLPPFYATFCNTESAEVSYVVVLGCVMHFMHDTLEFCVASVIIPISRNGEETSDV